jgi:hypothetical protein
MATTLNRANTCLLFSQRSATNEATIGDWFAWAYQYAGFTNAQYNSFVNNYNAWEADADAGTLLGTDKDGNIYSISQSPNHPHPPTR